MSDAPRLRRSALFVPGSSARALAKCRSLPCDVLILDLEDSVAPSAKDQARREVAGMLDLGGFGHREVVVRLNGLGTPGFDEDLRAVAAAGPDALLLPKIDSAEQVRAVSARLARSGEAPAPRLWIMAETPACVLDIDAIAAADPALDVIVMGTADLATALRVDPDPPREGLAAALARCVLAARARGLDILDGVHTRLDDDAGFGAVCEQGRRLGFDGKTLIHPAQIGTANEVFGVSGPERDRARRLLRCWREAAESGRGVAVLDGRMIERLHAEEALRRLALAAEIDRRAADGDPALSER